LGGDLVAEFRALTPARDPVAEHWRLRPITLSLPVLVLTGAIGWWRCSSGQRPGSRLPWPVWTGPGSS